MLATKFCIIFCTIILIIVPFSKSQTPENLFYNYRLFQVIAQTKTDLKILKGIEDASDNNYIFLNNVNIVNQNIEVVVAPHRYIKFQKLLKRHNILSQIIEPSFHSKIYTEILQNKPFSYSYFVTLNKIYEKLNILVQQYPKFVKQFVIGKTLNGNDLRIIKLSNQANNPEIKKPGIFIEGGTHARAWISPATVIFIMDKLLTSKDIVIQSLLNKYDWYFMPILNPDGYEFNEHETIWNKNRSPQTNDCYGVDLNRNWDMNWRNTTSQSTFKGCIEYNPGLYPFSEIETELLSKYLIDLEKNNRLHLYLSFQSGEQKLLYPYGSTKKEPDNADDLEDIAEVIVKALAKRRGTRYSYGSISNSKYPIYGTSIDWVYGVLGIPLSFRYELPNGFPKLRDVKNIAIIGAETFDSLVELISKAQSKGYFGRI